MPMPMPPPSPEPSTPLSRASRRSRLEYLPYATLLLALGLTLLVYTVFETTLHARARVAFTARVAEIADRIEERLQDAALLLRGTAGLFRTLPEVTRADWQQYVDTLQLSATSRGVQGVGFA